MLLVPVLSLASCGWIVGEIAEQKARQEALDDVRYDDLDKLWDEAVDLWDEYDCALPKAPKADETFDCPDARRWLRVKTASGGTYRVELEHETTEIETNDKGESSEKKVRSRDWELEFKLLERVLPEKARSIDEAAEAKGDKAKDAAKDLVEAFE